MIPLFTLDFHPTHMHMLQRVGGDWCSASWALGFCWVLSLGSCSHDAVEGPLGHGVGCGVCGGSRGPELAVFCWGAAGSVGLERSNRCPGWIIDSDAQNREHVRPLPLSMVSSKGAGGAIDGYVPRQASREHTSAVFRSEGAATRRCRPRTCK